jgi:sterol desaturase/sphingolipid hydroxylase (fatty acid hydroxylase superfamily)
MHLKNVKHTKGKPETFNLSEAMSHVLWILTAHYITFFTFSISCECSRKSEKRQAIRLPPTDEVLSLVLFNEIFVTGFLAFVFAPTFQDLPTDMSITDLKKLGLSILTSEILFYFIHFILHHDILMRNIHHIHHRLITDNRGFACVYAHPLEHMFQNVFPVMYGVYYHNVSLPATCFFVIIVTANGVVSHSGHKFLSNHWYHHERGFWDFRVLGFMDYFLDTSVKKALFLSIIDEVIITLQYLFLKTCLPFVILLKRLMNRTYIR